MPRSENVIGAPRCVCHSGWRVMGGSAPPDSAAASCASVRESGEYSAPGVVAGVTAGAAPEAHTTRDFHSADADGRRRVTNQQYMVPSIACTAGEASPSAR